MKKTVISNWAALAFAAAVYFSLVIPGGDTRSAAVVALFMFIGANIVITLQYIAEDLAALRDQLKSNKKV